MNRSPGRQIIPTNGETVARQIAQLKELIEALERRVPHIERLGEMQIAREAAALKEKALARIAELER